MVETRVLIWLKRGSLYGCNAGPYIGWVVTRVLIWVENAGPCMVENAGPCVVTWVLIWLKTRVLGLKTRVLIWMKTRVLIWMKIITNVNLLVKYTEFTVYGISNNSPVPGNKDQR